jgi:alcohol dehydrogenase YqhD (iron-dependent ADH family)
MKYVYRENIPKFAQFAERVWDVDTGSNGMESTALEGIARMEAFYREIGLPTSLSELDIGDDRLEEMAEKSVSDGPLGEFKKLNKEDIVNIYKLALK